MGLEFNASPYLQLWQQQQAQRAAQRPDPNAISQNIMQGLQGLADSRRQQQLLDITKQKNAADAANETQKMALEQRKVDYETGKPISPTAMFEDQPGTNGAGFGWMPGGQGQEPVNPGQGRTLIDAHKEWMANGKPLAGARPEFMEAMGKDERKQYFDATHPKQEPDYTVPQYDRDGNVTGFIPVPKGFKPTTPARPAAPNGGESLMIAGVDASGRPILVGNKTGAVSLAEVPGGGPIYPKNASDSQVNAGLFGKRATEANEQLSGLVQQGVDPTSLSLGVQGKLPNFLQSGNAQQLQQIKRNFVSAVLRKESGAAISIGEMANAEQQYFPQAGDSPEVLKQKEINRQTAIQGLNTAAGPMSNPGGAPQGVQPQGGGLPGVGQSFNGGRVLKVTRIQ